MKGAVGTQLHASFGLVTVDVSTTIAKISWKSYVRIGALDDLLKWPEVAS